MDPRRASHQRAWYLRGPPVRSRSVFLCFLTFVSATSTAAGCKRLAEVLEETGWRKKPAKSPSHSSMLTASVITDTTGDKVQLRAMTMTDPVTN